MATRRKRAGRVAEAPRSESRVQRLLLDTHVWLWWHTDDRRLGKRARRLIIQSDDARVSAASIWEMAIKAGVGKLTFRANLTMTERIVSGGFEVLAISGEHAESVQHLPTMHRDPFDRMLVVQALIEGLTILTADPTIAAYSVPVIDAGE